MAVLDRIATARDDTFAARVAMLLMASAINVVNEDPTTANHANRLAFAQRVLKGELNNKVVAAVVIADNATIQSEIDGAPSQLGSNVADNDLTFVINGIFTMLSDAYAAGV